MPTMNSSELASRLSSQRASAIASQSASEIPAQRADAIDYYMGDMSRDMPTTEGRSSAVSSDVADTIEGMMPSLMEIFAGSDEVVQFEPVGPEDVQAAEQETDYTNHVFMQENDGFLVLYSFIKDALLSKNGYVKVWWEDDETSERETYYDQSDDAFALLMQQVASSDDYQIVEHSTNADDTTGITSHDVTIEQTKDASRVCVVGVPPEEVGIERGARSLRDCNYFYHDVRKTKEELIEQGYDEDQITSLLPDTGQRGIESTSRDTTSGAGFAGGDKESQRLLITEHYVRMDYEGKGKSELYRVTTGGANGDVLRLNGKDDIQPIDMIPFAAMTPIPMPHRFFGRSIADLVMDIQRIKTALMRGMLDNVYLANNPRVEVAEENAGPNTLDDLLVQRPGGVVRTKRIGGIQWQVVPNISGNLFPAIEYMDATREWRTGVTRQGQGIDANALQNQSATAVSQAFTAAQARLRLIARIMAETGIKDMFALIHATIRKHGQQAKTVRLRNQWISVDPRNWKTRNDLTINVGLGTGGKQQRLASLTMLAGLQEKAMANGLTNLVSPEHLYSTAKEIVKALELKNVDAYFSDPKSQPPLQPKPDPKLIELQAKNEIEKTQAQADIAVQTQKTQAEIAANEQKQMIELQMARELHEMKMREMQFAFEAKVAETQARALASAATAPVEAMPQ